MEYKIEHSYLPSLFGHEGDMELSFVILTDTTMKVAQRIAQYLRNQWTIHSVYEYRDLRYIAIQTEDREAHIPQLRADVDTIIELIESEKH